MENKNCDNKNLSLMAGDSPKVAKETRNRWQPKNKKLPKKPGTHGSQGLKNNKEIQLDRSRRQASFRCFRRTRLNCYVKYFERNLPKMPKKPGTNGN